MHFFVLKYLGRYLSQTLHICMVLSSSCASLYPEIFSLTSSCICKIKGSMPPCINHMELLAWMQRADFSEHIQRFKLHGNPLNPPHFDAPNTKFAPTGYRRAPNIISHHYKQQL